MMDQSQPTEASLKGATDLSARIARCNDDNEEIKALQPSSASASSAAAVPKTRSGFDMQIENLSLPGYSVEQDGVFTVVRRTGSPGRSGTFPARIARFVIIAFPKRSARLTMVGTDGS
jgi:hypothetical protein